MNIALVLPHTALPALHSGQYQLLPAQLDLASSQWLHLALGRELYMAGTICRKFKILKFLKT